MEPAQRDSQPVTSGAGDPPGVPKLRTWRAVYLFVLGWFAFLVIVLAWFTQAFAR